MAEDLGALLRKKDVDYKMWLRQKAEEEELEKLRQEQAAIQAAKTYLENLKNDIVRDIKNGHYWNSTMNGLRYIISKNERWRVAYEGDNRWGPYYAQDKAVWQEFVDWAKEHGLLASIKEEGHDKRWGEEMWYERDYYYIFISALPQE